MQKMRSFIFLLCTFVNCLFFSAQELNDSLLNSSKGNVAEDPSQFISRIELLNEYQHFNNGINLNVTTLRSVLKIGKRFTSRLEIPYVYNSNTTNDYQNTGLGDINFRLLGFKLFESKKTAVSLSIEASLNTAQSPLLGTGKNVILLMASYTRVLIPGRMLFASAFQQAKSISGDASRTELNYSKLQAILLNFWSKKTWTVLAPECFIDYVKGGLTMNLEGRFAYAPIPKYNVWIKGGLGLFGNFIARYQWTAEIGFRRFIR